MREKVKAALDSVGIPVVHMAWKKGSAPSLPWIVYLEGDSEATYADGGNYHDAAEFVVELYQDVPSEELEGKLEDAISGIAPWWREEEIWVESEGCGLTTYHFVYRERKNNNG